MGSSTHRTSADAASDYLRFVREQAAEVDAGMRTWPQVALSVLIIGGVPFFLLIPGAATAVGLSFEQAMSVLSLVLVVIIATTAAYKRLGFESRAYRAFDFFETMSIQASLGTLIVLSGSAASAFWFFYVVHALFVSAHPSQSRMSYGAVLLTPVLVAGWFFAHEGVQTNFVWSLVGVAAGFLTVLFGATYQGRMSRLSYERHELERKVAALQLQGERGRIARDLHDGLTADLTAIAWRSEVLARSPGSKDPRQEFEAIALRARAAIDDTRSVVWALRDERVDWDTLTSHVGSRCTDLCGSRARFELRSHAADRQIPGQLALDIVRMVQESVRNALRHGDPKNVVVDLSVDTLINLTIDDDGVGLPGEPLELQHGGLSHLVERAKEHSGEAHFERLDPGTRVRLSLPLPTA